MTPKIGDVVYINTSIYIDSSWRDINGGKVTISKVVDYGEKVWITLKEFPEKSYCWNYLEDMQDYLKEEFGEQWAHK